MDPVLFGEILSIAMFAGACAVLLLGYPVAYTLGGVGLAFAILGSLGGAEGGLRLLGSLPSRFQGVMLNELLVAVPLFIFMGVMLERSRIAEKLLETMGLLFGTIRGGLGLSVCFVGMLLAASTGIVGATVVTMGLLSLPAMLKAGYDPKLACGTICASGTLGQIIPPSIVLVLLGDILQGANQDAQFKLGNFAPDPVSVIDLFAGAFIPGIVLVGLYMLWILVKAFIQPETCPALVGEAGRPPGFGGQILGVMLPPAILIVVVLGSILAGAATPTEAAAVGAVGATLLAGRTVEGVSPTPIHAAGIAVVVLLPLVNLFDLRMQRDVIPTTDLVAAILAGICCLVIGWGLWVSLLRARDMKILRDVMRTTVQVSSMVFIIIIGAAIFSLVFRGLGGEKLVVAVLEDLPGGLLGAMFVVMAFMFILGFFLDFIEIMFVVVPIVAPVLIVLGADPVWLGIMIAVDLQTSFLTPPFGFALFYLRGVAPPTVTTMDIYRGVVPFVIIQIIGLGLIAGFPGLATWLPRQLFG